MGGVNDYLDLQFFHRALPVHFHHPFGYRQLVGDLAV